MLESLKEDHRLDANMEGFCWASNVLYGWLFTNFIEVEKLDVCVRARRLLQIQLQINSYSYIQINSYAYK